MSLVFIDWLIIILYIALTLIIGLWYRKSAGKSLTNYFLGGRKLPWYLAGLSMVATTFAADTPLFVTEMVSKTGISGNWLWWNMLIGGMLTTFFFAKLWRRANVLTELEFIELRYSGKPAKFLRGFKAVYLGIFLNTIIIGWVNVALISILKTFFEISDNWILGIVLLSMIIATIYSSLSGLKGIVVTDAVQFIIAMTGSVILAVVVIGSDKIGGIVHLKDQLSSYGEGYLNFFPNISTAQDTAKTLTISIGAFLAFVGLQWWSSWYPGAEPGGGGYVAQRMMSTKSEKHSVFSTLLFQVAHYAIRPWPWILVGLAAVVLYPQLGVDDKKLGYVMTIREFMPIGLRGLLLVSLFAAYMSTISTQLNWGASFIVNDLFKRFLFKKTASEKLFVWLGRIATISIMFLSLIPTYLADTISELWEFLISCGAGLGLVLILRWYWKRINAWSEITATFVPIAILPVSNFIFHFEFPISLYFIVSCTTVVWLLCTFLTKPESAQTLTNFFRIIHPNGIFFSENKKNILFPLLICWISSVVFVYSVLFALGDLIFNQYKGLIIWGLIALFSLIALIISIKKAEI